MQKTDKFTPERAAAAWDEFVESGDDFYRTEVHGPGLLEACGNVEGLRVLDLGCGQGWFSRRLAENGAEVVGVDISERQIDNARGHETSRPLGIEYRLLSAERIAEVWSGDHFDMVAACMALHDMPEPHTAIAAVAAILKAGKRLVFSIPNPGTDTPLRSWERGPGGEKGALKIDWYFQSGPRMLKWHMERLKYHWQTPYWHHTLSEWSRMIAEAGFLVRRIHEPRPTQEQVERIPDLDDCYRLPYFLVADCVRT